MLDQLMPYILLLILITLIWVGVKFILKLTAKIFSCGCVVILVIAAVIYFLGGNGVEILR